MFLIEDYLIGLTQYTHNDDSDVVETDCFTGQDKTMQEFRITKDIMESFEWEF